MRVMLQVDALCITVLHSCQGITVARNEKGSGKVEVPQSPTPQPRANHVHSVCIYKHMDGSLSKYIAVHSATAVYHPPCQSIILTDQAMPIKILFQTGQRLHIAPISHRLLLPHREEFYL